LLHFVAFFHVASLNEKVGVDNEKALELTKNLGVGVLGSNVVPEVFDYDSGTNGTFQLFLEGDQGIFEVRNFFCYIL
jgi:hypothetical protein